MNTIPNRGSVGTCFTKKTKVPRGLGVISPMGISLEGDVIGGKGSKLGQQYHLENPAVVFMYCFLAVFCVPSDQTYALVLIAGIDIAVCRGVTKANMRPVFIGPHCLKRIKQENISEVYHAVPRFWQNGSAITMAHQSTWRGISPIIGQWHLQYYGTVNKPAKWFENAWSVELG